jgi:Zn-dependent protease with chaperone function
MTDVRRRFSGPRTAVTIFPELAGIVLLAALSLAPLVLSSGTEWVDWLIYHRGPVPAILTLEPLVGLDAWLHWVARLLLAAGVANVVFRRVGPYARFLRQFTGSRGRVPVRGTSLHRVASELGCLPSTLMVSDQHGPVAFTSGIVRPKIYVSETIVEALDAGELKLVVAHENRHRISRDPLRSLVATVLGDLFFWVPVARALVECVILKIEFAADDVAGKDDPAALAHTILKVAGLGVVDTPIGVASFVSTSVLGRRVRRLIGRERLGSAVLSRRSLAMTCAVLVGLWVLGLTAFGTHNAHLELAASQEVASLSDFSVRHQQ